LMKEVVTSGLCTGCAACIVACPYDVLEYDEGSYKPYHIEDFGGAENCTHGERGCTLCTRACPRFRDWEPEVDQYLFGRERKVEEVAGVWIDALLARATDPELRQVGQDGGVVSALLVWGLENDRMDAALVSGLQTDGIGMVPSPRVVTSRNEVLETAGSRYTYSANPLAYKAAIDSGAERIALVGMSCQASIPAVMAARKAGKVARRFVLSVGLLCSKTFEDAIFEELFHERYGIERSSIAKINIKGVFQIWTKDGGYHEVPLKEGHAWTREGCKSCPDFAAEHADISAGGIGEYPDWTLTIVRTQRGKEIIDAMIQAGAIEARPASEDPGALELMAKLSRSSRKRWPSVSSPQPGLVPALGKRA